MRILAEPFSVDAKQCTDSLCAAYTVYAIDSIDTPTTYISRVVAVGSCLFALQGQRFAQGMDTPIHQFLCIHDT